MDQAAYLLVLGKLVKGGTPTQSIDNSASDMVPRERALEQNQEGVMVSFQPPKLKFVPLAQELIK